MIKDERGREFSLFAIVTETLRYLNRELIKDCTKRQDTFTERNMLRVITVPAIWSDSARYFMRNAAVNAGIPADLLQICLEPESAAIYCRTVPCKSSKGDGHCKLLTLQPGEQYLVLDAGGGTVDIVVHEVEESGDLIELYPACGSDWGGTMVDRAFIDFMEHCIGAEAFSQFRRTRIYDFMDLMRTFESKKHSVKDNSKNDSVEDNSKNDSVEDNSKNARLVFRVPKSFQDMYQSSANKEPHKHVVPPDFALKDDKMRLPYERVLAFFSDSKERICSKLSDLFTTLKDVDTILMVGGYSDCPVLYNFVIETFKTKTVILAKEPRTAVLQGAVMFGHNPFVITERRCRYTYGIEGSTTFDANLHSRSKRFTDGDGIIRVDDIFKVHVKVGQIVKTGVFQPPVEYKPRRKDQTTLVLQLFASPKPDPLYIDETDRKKISSWNIDISDLKGEKSDKVVEVSLCYSEPLITVRAVKQQTGEEITHKVRYNWSTDSPTDQTMEVGSTTNKALILSSMTLGVSKCGCAFALERDPNHVVTIPLSQIIRDQYRQSSCILFDKEKNVKAFGIKAKERYENTKERKDWFFFKDFKVVFYGKGKVDRKTPINDVLGKKFELFEVVKETIRYLKREICRFIDSQPGQMNEFDIHFVLSVPNTFTDSVRRFIADAAQEAEIPRTRLILCSEADSVLAYCKSVSCQYILDSMIVEIKPMVLDPMQTYGVCIAGNQRVSFTAVEVNDSGQVRESRDMGSGEWGFNAACGSFLKFLHDVFGEKVVSEAERLDKDVLNKIKYDFKAKSRHLSISSDSASYVYFRIPPILQERKKQTHSALDNEVSFHNDKLRFTQQKMFDFHKKSLERIANHLSAKRNGDSFNLSSLHRGASSKLISTIILVGEFYKKGCLKNYRNIQQVGFFKKKPMKRSAAVCYNSFLLL